MPDDDFMLDVTASASVNSAALRWYALVQAGDFGSAWAAMDADFRRALTQDWIGRNPAVMSDPTVTGDRDELAAELSVPAPTHPMWQHLSRVTERGVRGATTDLFAGRELGAGVRPRPMGVDLMLVRLMPLDELAVDENGMRVFAPGQMVLGLSLLMRRVDAEWQVAGVGDGLLRPGWPPVFERIVDPAD
jgi:hypothetical protein